VLAEFIVENVTLTEVSPGAWSDRAWRLLGLLIPFLVKHGHKEPFTSGRVLYTLDRRLARDCP
jgi:hypothetical protein